MTPRLVDVWVEENPDCEPCQLRWKMEDEPQPVTRVRWSRDGDPAIEYRVAGWSSTGGGTPVAAQGVRVEDSGSGTAILVWGGDWGVRLDPVAGGTRLAEPYLKVDPEDILG